MAPIIRHATEQDVPVILELIKELAEYENAAHEVEATVDSLLATLSFPSSTAPWGWTPGCAKTLLVAEPQPAHPEALESGARPVFVGMALYFQSYSTWLSAPGMFLEDLFVRPQFRGKGYGKALLAEMAGECIRLGYRRLEWSVLKWNKLSIDFYLSEYVGGKVMEEWQGIRVEGQQLATLASFAQNS